tara:strand:- start:518 stop:1024 length:507 start_codon:yes stop_codon:yes gene_type:complete
MSNNQQHTDIKRFKKTFFNKHNVEVYVFTPEQNEYMLSLATLKKCAYNAFVQNNPKYKYIESMASRVRYREFQIYYQSMSHIAYLSGHKKTNIGKSINKNHASIINAVRMVENAFFCKDREMIGAYKQILKEIIKDVGTIPENIKRKIDSQPNSNLVWDEEQNSVTTI